jgi:hypothetical protein
MSLYSEFKASINCGSVVDLAVGVIIGAAFGKIVTSIVEDLVMPPTSKVAGNLGFTNLYISLSDKITPRLPKTAKHRTLSRLKSTSGRSYQMPPEIKRLKPALNITGCLALMHAIHLAKPKTRRRRT